MYFMGSELFTRPERFRCNKHPDPDLSPGITGTLFMYLKEIVINGFKSFANRTRLDLESGVIAIVGPNGCGKSNIADAIRWVLGEQSAKALRGGKMQDVIFEGSEKRKGLNLCEVTLKFADCEKQLGTAFNEVEIGRRVTREGSSDYSLNGKICRLKDIQRLFMDTGVGRVSYSFLVQGQIDQILSSNPADRRIIFEEAAGITKYKAQRRETMNKLALVETNLARVTDVIEEVSRQIGSLKRQASKALRYKRLHHRLTHLDRAQTARNYQLLQKEIESIEKESEALRKLLEEAQRETTSRQDRLEAERGGRSTLYDKLQELQQKVYALRSEKENAENKVEFARLRRKDLQERIGELEQEINDLRKQQESLTKRAADDSEVKQLQLDLVGSSDAVFQEKSQDMFEAQEQLNRAENELQDHKQRLLLLESSISRLRSNQTSLEVDLKTYQVKHGGLKDSLKELEHKREELEANLATYGKSRSRLEREHADLEREVETLREEARGQQGAFRDLQERIQSRDRELARRSAHLQVLEELNASFEGVEEGSRAILQNRLDDILPEADRSLLTAGLRVPDAYATAFESILETARDTVIVKDAELAFSVIERLKTEALGRACLKVPVPSVEGGEKTPAELPEGCRSILEVVEVEADLPFAEVYDSFLGDSYFCEDLGAFLRFWEAHPGFLFHRVATREGEVLDRRGLLHGGAGSGGEGESFLKRQNEIRSLQGEIGKEEEVIAGLRKEADTLQEQMNGLESKLEERRARLVEMGKELSNLSVQEQSVQEGLFQNEAQQAAARQQIKTLEEAHAESEARLKKAVAELEEAEEEIGSQRELIRKSEEQVKGARETRDARREGLADIRLQLAEKKQRLEAIDRNLGALKEKSTELHELRLRREQEMDTLHEQIRERDGEEAAEVRRAEEVEATLKVLRETLDGDRKAFQEAENRVQDLEKDLSRFREIEREREGALNRHDVRLAELRSRRGFLLEKVHSDFHVEVESIDWKAELWKADEAFVKRVDLDALEEGEAIEAKPKEPRGDPTPEDLEQLEDTDWNAVEEEVNSLKERVQSMGPVNLVAIEEYADLSQRYQFLKDQSEDLWNSKEELLKAIDEINTISQTLFRETFEQVTKNFKYTYDQLTGGGFADLTLVDAEDILDSGIEITARPPGTKLKSISLLSGGQKTMTAVALLFAIYMVKPSTFCVLDELDAPLDDANIGRFTTMLKRFTEFSQFLIITHNKRTIASANAIFGVTMPEKGVSRLISMRFNHERGEAEMLPTAEKEALSQR